MSDAEPDPTPVHFEAVLHPHRSLTPAGFSVLMGLFGGVSMAFGTAFLLIGAWPVFGLFGLDVLLLWYAFRRNDRDAAVYETVRLTDRLLTVRRFQLRREPQVWRFEPGWLRVIMDDPPEHHSQLTLTSHGRSLVIGNFLTPEERLGLARALADALRRWRSPP